MGNERNLVVERTYKATPEEIWELWTTKDGFESWWGPEGFRVEVHELDARLGGTLRYDMIADAPAVIEEMKKQGQPLQHGTSGNYSEFQPRTKLALTHLIDFLPGVKPYQSVMVMELIPAGKDVRMVVTLSPMHNPEFSKMQLEGFTSQLTKLDRRFNR